MTAETKTSDYAAQMRRDLQQGIPAYIILSAAKRHVMALRLLSNKTGETQRAMYDHRKLIEELENGRD